MPRQKQPAPPQPRGRGWWIGGTIGVVAGAAFFLIPTADRQAVEEPPQQAAVPTSATPATTSAPVPEEPKVPAVGPLPPLPLSGAFPAVRPPQVIRAVYEFAARHPEVLRYVPCYCGCERNGHIGNDDCFIASRDAHGNVTWEPHGMT